MKIYCENCGAELEVAENERHGQVRCAACKTVFTPDGESAAVSANPVAQAVANVAGLDAVRGFSWSGLFSEVFQSHSTEAIEAYWSSGSVGNIPGIDKIDTNWPKPWIFVRVFLLTLIAWGLLFLGWKYWQNPNFLPGLILVGSFAVPLSLVVFFFEMNVRRNVSLYETLKTFLVGGVLSLIVSMFMFNLSSAAGLGWMGASVAGIAEETGKLLAVILFVRMIRYPYILNGLLFGAAVGAGFAAFESAGYALMAFIRGLVLAVLQHAEKIAGAVNSAPDAAKVFSGIAAELTQFGASPMFNLILTRALWCGVAGHVLWTGMSAAALWIVKGNRKFEWGMVLDIRFLRVFLIAVLSHMVWNSPWEPQWISEYDKFILIALANWAVIFAVIQSGLNQLRREKAACQAEPEKEPEVAAIIREQIVYVEKLTAPAAPAASVALRPDKFPGDHLGIRQEVTASEVVESRRETPKFADRAWKKYYRKDQ